MGRREGRMLRLEAKLKPPIQAVRVLVTFVQPDGSESVPHVLVHEGDPRPATAAEIAGDGAGCVVTMREPGDFGLQQLPMPCGTQNFHFCCNGDISCAID
jgi:hypothetical protein